MGRNPNAMFPVDLSLSEIAAWGCCQAAVICQGINNNKVTPEAAAWQQTATNQRPGRGAEDREIFDYFHASESFLLNKQSPSHHQPPATSTSQHTEEPGDPQPSEARGEVFKLI